MYVHDVRLIVINDSSCAFLLIACIMIIIFVTFYTQLQMN